eukprot:4599851-Pyramimonas_sp.AAC.1
MAFQGVGSAAEAYEVVKRTHLDTEALCRQQGLLFIPLVAEPTGGWGPTGAATLRLLARASDARLGEEPGSGATRLFQQLSVAIRRASARAILRRQAEEAPASGAVAAARDVLAEEDEGSL